MWRPWLGFKKGLIYKRGDLPEDSEERAVQREKEFEAGEEGRGGGLQGAVGWDSRGAEGLKGGGGLKGCCCLNNCSPNNNNSPPLRPPLPALPTKGKLEGNEPQKLECKGKELPKPKM